MVELTLKVQSRGGRARVLSHVGRPIKAGRVRVGWGVLTVGRSSHPQLYAGQASYPVRGTRESHVLGVLSYTLIFAVCLDWAGVVTRIEWCWQ